MNDDKVLNNWNLWNVEEDGGVENYNYLLLRMQSAFINISTSVFLDRGWAHNDMLKGLMGDYDE